MPVLAGAWLGWGRASAVWGVIIGTAAGLLPVVTWHWVLTFTDTFRRRRLMGIGVVLLKFTLMGLALFVLSRSGALDLLPLLAGLSTVTLALVVLGLTVRPGAREA
jgi:hypothetical protein